MSQDQRLDPHEIYYGVQGERHGPVDLERIRALIEHGNLRADDFIWLPDEEEWMEAANVPLVAQFFGVEELNAPGAPPHPRWGQDLPYAGFWVRLVAHFIDAMVLFLPSLVWFSAVIAFSGIDPELLRSDRILADLFSSSSDTAAMQERMRVELMAWGGFWIMELIYRSLLESSPWQATLGKRVLGLVVTDTQGRRLSLPRAALRHVGKLLSQIPLNMGFVLIAFHEKKQGLHDLVAQTLVLRK